MISEEIIARIKEENDIVDVISEDVRLKRSGANYMGLCPFHNEKSPSFVVSSEKQIFKCFGCNEAGNVISYIMKTRRFNFPEACKYLAERVNIEIKEDNAYSQVKDKKKKYYNINVEAARFFFNNLKKNTNAKEYFLKRGINQKTINKFGLGYSMDSWNSILNYLKDKGYSELDLLKLGLIIQSKNGRYYDRFRNRIIFPVFDVSGKVIGFGGRVLDDSKPKYLNSPETILFKKGINLYGLNFAIKNLRTRQILIVEGYMDCIALAQHGITNVAASLGTAFTEKQAKLLKRYVDEIIISFDSDEAGIAASLRGIEILKKEGFRIRVLTIPDGKDPDEYIKKHGKEEFLQLINEAENLTDYKIKILSKDIDFRNNEHVIEFIRSAADVLSDLDPVEKDIYIRKICDRTGVNEQAFYDMLNMNKNIKEKKSKNMNENGNLSQKLYLEPAYLKGEKSILKLMMNKEFKDYILELIEEEDIIFDVHKKILKLIIEGYEKSKDDIQKFVELNCKDFNLTKEFIKIRELNIEFDSIDKYYNFIDNCYYEIRKFKLEESKKEIMRMIKEYERKGLIEECLSLANDLKVVENELVLLGKEERR